MFKLIKVTPDTKHNAANAVMDVYNIKDVHYYDPDESMKQYFYIATDPNGFVFAYTARPFLRECVEPEGESYWDIKQGDYVFIGECESEGDWKESLSGIIKNV